VSWYNFLPSQRGLVSFRLARRNYVSNGNKTLPVTLEELIVSSLAQTDPLAKLLIEKGLTTREEFYAEDFRGTGDVSEVAESDAAMNAIILTMLGIPVHSLAWLTQFMETLWKHRLPRRRF
jgi:hypothetical protein